jgi:predicted site-specific integrase-resolvase
MRQVTVKDIADGAIKTSAVAKRLRVTRMTLHRWRAVGKDPACVKIGGTWWYPLNHLRDPRPRGR